MRITAAFTAFGRALTVGVCLLALGACGSSTSKKSSVSSTGAAASPSAPRSTSRSVDISVKELAPGSVVFSVPASIQSGLVRLQLTNSGQKVHSAQIIKIDPGHTVQDVVKMIGSNTNKTPPWLHGVGGVGNTGPGASSSAQVVLPAGTYYLFDLLGMNPSKGFGTLRVQGAGSAAALPATQATITAHEIGPKRSAFKVSGLKAGNNAINFQNPASNKDQHQFAAIELRPGATLAEVTKFLASPGKPSGPPPFAGRPGGGGRDAAIIDPGFGEIASVNLKAGASYALVCFLSDRDGGPPHFTQGMIAKVNVK